jgi:regulator of PEP synthase PpsR (kinase-PPPase family)
VKPRYPNTSKPTTGDPGINDDELEKLLEEHQFDIVDIIETTTEMLEYEEDSERETYLEKIHEYADAYLQTFETDKQLYRN